MAQRELAGVTHLVSTVEGRLRAGRAARRRSSAATFPGGSVTGAPKIAAVDLIAALEPVGRGASMGALGVLRPDGDFELALTIRTLAVADGRAHLWVGGGIVWDSDPEAEIEESWVKARPAAAPRSAGSVRRRDRAARVARRGPGARRSRRAGLLRRRRGAAARRRRVRDGARPRRAARCCSTGTSSGSSARRSRCGCRRPSGVDGARRRGGRRRGHRRGRPAALPDEHDAGRDRRRRCRPASRRCASAGSPSSPSASHDAGLLTGVKATSYATALAAVAEAERRGADDALYLGDGETVLEATMSNIWWRDGDVLITPVALDRRARRASRARRARRLAQEAGYRVARGLVHAAGAARLPRRRSRARPSARSCR